MAPQFHGWISLAEIIQKNGDFLHDLSSKNQGFNQQKSWI
jgi:hypothetical protein